MLYSSSFISLSVSSHSHFQLFIIATLLCRTFAGVGHSLPLQNGVGRYTVGDPSYRPDESTRMTYCSLFRIYMDTFLH